MALADPESHGGNAEDAFNIVVLSLTGFCFSGPLDRTGVGYFETTDRWVRVNEPSSDAVPGATVMKK